LLHDEGDINNDPAEHAGAQLAPGFDVNFTEDGQGNARVQFAANEPVVQHIAGAATSGELATIRVVGVLDAEGANIAEGGKEVGDENVGGENANIVIGDEGPDGKLGAMCDGSSGEQGQDE
tara:strand:- start:10969 stop:11331 length:363 start_codon:yes stop_codon:yes gene_type:complete